MSVRSGDDEIMWPALKRGQMTSKILGAKFCVIFSTPKVPSIHKIAGGLVTSTVDIYASSSHKRMSQKIIITPSLPAHSNSTLNWNRVLQLSSHIRRKFRKTIFPCIIVQRPNAEILLSDMGFAWIRIVSSSYKKDLSWGYLR